MQRFAEVSQEDEWGCAAACVASLIAVPYERAKRWLVKEKGAAVSAKHKGFEVDEIARALFKQGTKVIADWNPPATLPDGTIVCLYSRVRFRDFHYVLKVPGGYMDPWFDLKQDKLEAKWRPALPKGTQVYVALIPVSCAWATSGTARRPR